MTVETERKGALRLGGNAGPLALFQVYTIPWAYAMLHLFLNPLTGSRAFIGRVESGYEAQHHQLKGFL